MYIVATRPIVAARRRASASRARITTNWQTFRDAVVWAKALPALHTNGCGDFTLMSRDAWFALRGYPELPTFSMFIDSLFVYMAYWHGLKALVEHIDFSVGNWMTDGHDDRAFNNALHFEPSGEGSCFGRPVYMQQSSGRPFLQHSRYPPWFHCFTTKQHVVYAGQHPGRLSRYLVKQRRRQEKSGDPLSSQLQGKFSRREHHFPTDAHQSRSVQQRAPYLKRRCIK